MALAFFKEKIKRGPFRTPCVAGYFEVIRIVLENRPFGPALKA
jgi:hypothetical protein